ncbi:MAG: chromosome segregation protein SMC [Elusimicrobia bacterium]|nr:chromosome segregation protein SMC [Elusimicrobiota bacterium]
MYLKSIELSGFKSFAEPTEISLEPGIVCVVGPNGCGKSNVVDAIRWSLGELSPKTLRSKSIADVIFNGTRRLSPAAQAQITLTFDNSDRALGVDAPEVSVQRKVSRDGGGEYAINKASCRLKDIKGLFLGTGLGDDGYSIMEGSMVEFLLTAKPLDRRLLFDEASGAARFSSKRDEALSRLSKIDQDLDRVRDQIELLAAEKKRIENQAKKAKLFEKLSGQKRELGVRKVLADLDRTETRAQAIQEETLEPKRAQMERKTVALNQHYAKAETLKAGRAELEAKSGELSKDFHEVLRARDVAAEKLRHLESRLSELRSSRETRLLEKEDLIKQRQALNEEIETAGRELAVKEKELEETSLQLKQDGGLNEELAGAASRRDEMQRHIQDLRNRIIIENQEITRLRNESLGLTTELSQWQVELKHTLKEHHREDLQKLHLEERNREIEARIQALKGEIEELETKRVQTADLQAQQIDACRRLEDALYRGLTQEEAALEARRRHWEIIAEQDPYVRGALATDQISGEQGGVYGPIGKLIKTSPQHHIHLKEILGERLNWFLAENAEAALKIIDLLGSGRKGRAAFVLLDRLTETPQPVTFNWGREGAIGRIVELDYLLGSTDARTKQAIFRLVGPTFVQGSSVFGEALVRGGEEPAAQKDINTLSAVEEREAVAKAMADLSVKKQELGAQVAESGHEKERLSSELQTLLESLRAKNLESAGLIQEKESNDRDLSLAQESVLSMEKEARRYLEDSAAKKEMLTQMEETLRGKDELIADLHKQLDEGNAALEKTIVETKSGREARLARDLELERCEHEKAVAREKKNQLDKAVALTAEQAGRLEAAVNDLDRDLEELANRIEDLKNELSELDRAHEEKGRAMEVSREELEKSRTLISAVESDIAFLDEDIRKLDEEVKNAQVELRALEYERARVVEEAVRIFGAAAEELPAKLEQAKTTETTVLLREGESVEDALLRIEEQISRLGQINFLAQEEYDRLTERLTFLETQREDILKAKADVGSAIAKVNAQIEESFSVTFAAVREKFREIFATLFEGGEADLVLTESQDLTQRGVEIFAQPPGKKLQTITQLSQGEKALTAVSLLFAFFSINPAPVCILDEIDAPLDETNVLRFRRMLEKFSQKCQFLVITHNKRTMEAARSIYGVTMEELGVSKIISVKLEEATATVS